MSWTDYDENTWEYAAGKVMATYKCDGPYRAVKPTYEELFDTDQFDTLARKAMGELNRSGAHAWRIDDQVELLARKQHDYGHDNINKFGPLGVRVRLWDKVARLGNLLKRGGVPENESVQDTLMDIVGYCVIYGMVKNGTFSNLLSADMSEGPV